MPGKNFLRVLAPLYFVAGATASPAADRPPIWNIGAPYMDIAGNWIVYLVSMPAGFVLFAITWLRLMRRQRPATP